MGFGNRTAVVVIDAQKYMVGEPGQDAEWPSSCGDVGRRAVGAIATLVRAAQASGVPCFFSRFELAADGSDIGVYRRKRDLLQSPHWCLEGTLGAELVPELSPKPGDVVFVKKEAQRIPWHAFARPSGGARHRHGRHRRRRNQQLHPRHGIRRGFLQLSGHRPA